MPQNTFVEINRDARIARMPVLDPATGHIDDRSGILQDKLEGVNASLLHVDIQSMSFEEAGVLDGYVNPVRHPNHRLNPFNRGLELCGTRVEAIGQRGPFLRINLSEPLHSGHLKRHILHQQVQRPRLTVDTPRFRQGYRGLGRRNRSGLLRGHLQQIAPFERLNEFHVQLTPSPLLTRRPVFDAVTLDIGQHLPRGQRHREFLRSALQHLKIEARGISDQGGIHGGRPLGRACHQTVACHFPGTATPAQGHPPVGPEKPAYAFLRTLLLMRHVNAAQKFEVGLIVADLRINGCNRDGLRSHEREAQPGRRALHFRQQGDRQLMPSTLVRDQPVLLVTTLNSEARRQLRIQHRHSALKQKDRELIIRWCHDRDPRLNRGRAPGECGDIVNSRNRQPRTRRSDALIFANGATTSHGQHGTQTQQVIASHHRFSLEQE